MPAELFRSQAPATPVRRRASLIPISVATHVVVIAAFVLGPLVAPGELPEPNRPLLYAVTPVDLPPPPPVRMTPPPSTRSTGQPSSSKAPLEPPATISPESSIEPTSFGATVDGDALAGLPGLEGGIELPSPVQALPPPPKPTGPVEVGGQIEAPRRLKSVAPLYPTVAQLSRVEGAVIIEAIIDERGRVRDARVVEGKPLLNGAALDAVKQWEFSPTRLNGQPVAVIMKVTVVFSLR